MTKEISRFITEELINDPDFDALGVQEDLMGSGLIDSLGMIRLVGFIETTYGIQVPVEDLTIENFKSLETINNYLSSK